MPNPEANPLIEAIAVTAEICGTQFSAGAARTFADDLSQFPLAQVLGALKRCRHELKGRLTVSEILSRLDDGRPGVEEAWTTAIRCMDEEATLIWTAETVEASGAARALLLQGDPVAARMAFREVYTQRVNTAREQARPVEWQVSLGYDRALQREALRTAVADGKIAACHAESLSPGATEPNLPMLPGDKGDFNALLTRLAQTKTLLLGSGQPQGDE